MKIFSRKNLRQLVFLQVLMALVLSGCGKKPTPPVEPPTATDSAPAPAVTVAQPTRPPVASTAPRSQLSLPADATAQAAAEQLSIELRRYVLATRTIPKDFNDFVARHPMKFPPAPAGKSYAIEDGKVVLR